MKESSNSSELEKKEAAAIYAKIVFGIIAYASCSSMMLIINKLAVTFLPAPSVVLFCQLLTSAVAIKLMHEGGLVESDPLIAEKVKPFMLVAIAFLGALYTNVKTLQYANVETFIVFRSSTPILIAFLDYVFLGRQLPNMRSWLSLMAILMGAIAYVFTDSNFEVKAYTWVMAWFVVFAFDQVYIKFAVDNVKLTPWGRSYYTNLLAVVPVFLLGVVTREHEILTDFEWSTASIFALSASCVAGVLMSYSQFLLRGLISATSFTVVGTMCKIGTVIINCMIWDKHASMDGLIALFICIFSGLFYQQSPLRNSIQPHAEFECKYPNNIDDDYNDDHDVTSGRVALALILITILILNTKTMHLNTTDPTNRLLILATGGKFGVPSRFTSSSSSSSTSSSSSSSTSSTSSSSTSPFLRIFVSFVPRAPSSPLISI